MVRFYLDYVGRDMGVCGRDDVKINADLLALMRKDKLFHILSMISHNPNEVWSTKFFGYDRPFMMFVFTMAD